MIVLKEGKQSMVMCEDGGTSIRGKGGITKNGREYLGITGNAVAFPEREHST